MHTLRYAWRSLARSKGFVAVAILALGLGLGLSTTMFAVLDAIVNPYVPYKDPRTLFTVSWRYSPRDTRVEPGILYGTVRDQVRGLVAIVPISTVNLALDANNGGEVYAARIRPSFFAVTGVRPRLGRGFVESDGDDVVVLSDGLWRRLFGRRSSLAGATVSMGGRVYSVIGVMPRGLIVPSYATAWIPLAVNASPGLILTPLARLRPGVSPAQARAELQAIAAVLTTQYASREHPISLSLNPVRMQRQELHDINKAMVGAALSVLFIACLNLAHLMLARGLAKRRELALRMALGASRAAVVRQMFAECVMITAGGAALGALGAVWGCDLLINRATPWVSWIGLVQPQLSWRVFALSAVAATASSVLFGLIPALRVAFTVSLDEPLKDGAGTTGRSRHRFSPLVIVEVALALVLMMGGGLLLRAVQQMRSVQYTFDDQHLLLSYVGSRALLDTAHALGRNEITSPLRTA